MKSATGAEELDPLISFIADVAQLVELLICNQQVGGSSPSIGSNRIFQARGESPARSNGADCKSVGVAFGGSIPPLPTNGNSEIAKWRNSEIAKLISVLRHLTASLLVNAEVAHLVERKPSKLQVAGSSPVFRSCLSPL